MPGPVSWQSDFYKVPTLFKALVLNSQLQPHPPSCSLLILQDCVIVICHLTNILASYFIFTPFIHHRHHCHHWKNILLRSYHTSRTDSLLCADSVGCVVVVGVCLSLPFCRWVKRGLLCFDWRHRISKGQSRDLILGLSDRFCYLFEDMCGGSKETYVLCIPKTLSCGAEMARVTSSWSMMLSMNPWSTSYFYSNTMKRQTTQTAQFMTLGVW